MDTWIWIAIGVFVVADGVGTVFLLRYLRARKAQAAAPPADDAPPQMHL